MYVWYRGMQVQVQVCCACVKCGKFRMFVCFVQATHTHKHHQQHSEQSSKASSTCLAIARTTQLVHSTHTMKSKSHRTCSVGCVGVCDWPVGALWNPANNITHVSAYNCTKHLHVAFFALYRYGTQKARLGRDSQIPFGFCALSLEQATDPVARYTQTAAQALSRGNWWANTDASLLLLAIAFTAHLVTFTVASASTSTCWSSVRS